MNPNPLTTATDCPHCARLRHELDLALARIVVLEAQLQDLLAQLRRNSSNSSMPPSADPPGAPKPTAKTPTGRRPGGQPGHRGQHRVRLDPDRVDAVVDYVPTACTACDAALPDQPGPDDPEPAWHQVAELPRMAAVVTEHRAHARTCPGCGTLNRAAIPEAVRAHVLGPRLAATMSYLSGRFHLGKRGVREFVAAVFEVPVALGTVANLERQTGVALGVAHDQARAAVRAAAVKNADETGWTQAGTPHWLWTAATDAVACFQIHRRRGVVGLKALLGEVITGIVTSDRGSAYNDLPLEQRQVCWAHLKRDFRKCSERAGPGKFVGDIGLVVVEDLFGLWRSFRAGRIDRAELGRLLEPAMAELRGALDRGRGCGDRPVMAFCKNLSKLYPALWRFAAVAGVEPTNNHAERMLRAGVLWRKNGFGSQSAWGCRFVERMLTVVQTLRLQGRSVLEFLAESVIAQRSGTPAPALILPG